MMSQIVLVNYSMKSLLKSHVTSMKASWTMKKKWMRQLVATLLKV